MDIIYSIILGAIQGLTEFLPISSSGHLVILHDFLKFNLESDLAFDVALHTGTLLALLTFFFKDIIHYFTKERKMLWIILVGAFPAALVGFFLEDVIDFYLRFSWIVAIMLIIGGILFLVAEKYSKLLLDLKDLTWKKALFVGLAQILALIPGTSRSGITIIAGMGAKLKREQAARFSFLIGLPIFFGATLIKAYDLTKMNIPSNEWILFAVGLITAFIVGFLCIKYLLLFLEKHTLKIFAYYRFILAFIIILFLIFK
ncbi:undecaprenyl-diphosphatase UppP [Patescibacteria group bacterium]|nr:undecaprenyl-diphosphatase UppP [Patescibacteria group bacterium]